MMMIMIAMMMMTTTTAMMLMVVVMMVKEKLATCPVSSMPTNFKPDFSRSATFSGFTSYLCLRKNRLAKARQESNVENMDNGKKKRKGGGWEGEASSGAKRRDGGAQDGTRPATSQASSPVSLVHSSTMIQLSCEALAGSEERERARERKRSLYLLVLEDGPPRPEAHGASHVGLRSFRHEDDHLLHHHEHERRK